jgi:hypothetical protein
MVEHDFEVLYKNEPSHIRANANLPGHLVYTLTKLNNHAEFMENLRKALENTNEGYSPFGDTVLKVNIQELWRWEDYGIPETLNPVRDLIEPYSQFSRAESMKGSEQVVRGFAGFRPEGELNDQGEPNLMPKNTAQGTTVIVQNGMKELKQKKGLMGLGGR